MEGHPSSTMKAQCGYMTIAVENDVTYKQSYTKLCRIPTNTNKQMVEKSSDIKNHCTKLVKTELSLAKWSVFCV